MSENNTIIVPTITVAGDFKNHLLEDQNERILFSAPFGSGKSTFLKEFFDGNSNYITLKLYPVNYSVAPNEDVFELIKYDLIYELLSKYPDNIELENEQFSTLLLAQVFLMKKVKLDVVLRILSKIGELSNKSDMAAAAIEVGNESMMKALDDFSKFRKEMESGNLKVLDTYVKSFKTRKGHIHEMDEVTELICNMLQTVKDKKLETSPSCQTVLLIDDLDRLDPENNFRLFNIFTAHHDEVTGYNKFGFDKVIFVCDINNIAQMFNHKYGIDFSGYINKFYSIEPFKFNIKAYLKESTDKLIKSKDNLLRFWPDSTQISFDLVNRYSLSGDGKLTKCLKKIIYRLIDINIVRIRDLHHFSFSIPNYTFNIPHLEKHAALYPLLVLVKNLENLFARPEDLESALKRLSVDFEGIYEHLGSNQRDQLDRNASEIIGMSLMFIINENRVFSEDFQEGEEYNFPYINEQGMKVYFIYRIQIDHAYDCRSIQFIKCVLENTSSNGTYNSPALTRPNYYWLLYNAYMVCKRKGFI